MSDGMSDNFDGTKINAYPRREQPAPGEPRCTAKLNGNPPPTCRLSAGHSGNHESVQPHGILSWAEPASPPVPAAPANTTTVIPCGSEDKSETGRVKLSGVQDPEGSAQVVGGPRTTKSSASSLGPSIAASVPAGAQTGTIEVSGSLSTTMCSADIGKMPVFNTDGPSVPAGTAREFWDEWVKQNGWGYSLISQRIAEFAEAFAAKQNWELRQERDALTKEYESVKKALRLENERAVGAESALRRAQEEISRLNGLLMIE